MQARATSTVLGWVSGTVLALSLVGSSACEPDPTVQASGRGLEAPSSEATGGPPAADAPAAPGSRRSSLGNGGDSAPSLGYSSVPSQSAAAAEDPSAPPRELSRELQAMMGQPLACLAGASPAPTISVNVSTIVDAHGNVLRATAAGPLTPEGLACMQARAQGLRFRAPVPRAPIHVTASLVFRMTDPGVAASTTVIEQPRVLPPGAVDPMSGSAVPIAAQPGQAISARPGQAIAPTTGQAIAPTQGVAIMGPSGTPIGR